MGKRKRYNWTPGPAPQKRGGGTEIMYVFAPPITRVVRRRRVPGVRRSRWNLPLEPQDTCVLVAFFALKTHECSCVVPRVVQIVYSSTWDRDSGRRVQPGTTVVSSKVISLLSFAAMLMVAFDKLPKMRVIWFIPGALFRTSTTSLVNNQSLFNNSVLSYGAEERLCQKGWM